MICRFVLSHLEVVDSGVSVVVLGEERVERAQLPSEGGGNRGRKGDHNWVAAVEEGETCQLSDALCGFEKRNRSGCRADDKTASWTSTKEPFT